MIEAAPEAGPSVTQPLAAGTTSTAQSKSKSNGKRESKAKTAPAPAPAGPRAKPLPRPIEAFDNPGEGEEETVHEVYERIAPHFSQTRHKVGHAHAHAVKATRLTFRSPGL